MILINTVQDMVETGAYQLLTWVTQFLPKVFLFLILLNALTSLIGRSRVERLAARCGSNALLRYMVLPFLSAVVLGNPMAISMGRYLPERYKPAYFASASYHCHTNSGFFQHINPAELFLWLGIANGVLARGQDLFPLALRYLLAGLVAHFVSGYATACGEKAGDSPGQEGGPVDGERRGGFTCGSGLFGESCESGRI